MIIEVIPAVRMPKHLNYFSYLVPSELRDKLKVGQIVEVNFHGRNCPALITDIYPDKKNKHLLKLINKILFPEILITPQQIDLIQKIADYYAVSAGTVCKSMLPQIPKRHKNTGALEHWSTGALNQEIKNLRNQSLIWWQNIKERNKRYLEIIQQTALRQAQAKQILILVPQIELIDKIIQDLNLNQNQVIKIHNKISQSKTKFFNLWLEILSGMPKIIIGTKISVLLPFNNLGAVIIDQEQDWNHKQSDINPRYDARKIAGWLAEDFDCPLYLSTPAPRVETFHFYAQKHSQIKILEYKNKIINNNNLSIIDLHQENLKGNYTFLSDELIEKIQNNLQKNKKVFLLHNRKGTAGLVNCLDCSYTFKCPGCDISLVYYDGTKKMHCHHCNFSQDTPPLCPKCNGPKLNFKSKGLEDIAGKLKKIFTQQQSKSASNNTFGAAPPEQKIGLLYKQQNPDPKRVTDCQIIIGTQFALNKINWSEVGLVGIINFGQLTSYPDFRSLEKAYQLIGQLLASAPRADFIIQSYEPKNIVLQSLTKNEPSIFYQNELECRRQLNYPPFGQLIKVIYQDKSSARAYYQCDKMFKNLKKMFDNQVEILGPLPAYPRLIRSKYRYHIILKIKNKLTSKQQQNIFKHIPSNFVIDVDPEKLI